jgi:hypothetical protein
MSDHMSDADYEDAVTYRFVLRQAITRGFQSVMGVFQELERLRQENATLRTERDTSVELLLATHQQVAEVARLLDPGVCPDTWGLRAAAQRVLAERDTLRERVRALEAAIARLRDGLWAQGFAAEYPSEAGSVVDAALATVVGAESRLSAIRQRHESGDARGVAYAAFAEATKRGATHVEALWDAVTTAGRHLLGDDTPAPDVSVPPGFLGVPAHVLGEATTGDGHAHRIRIVMFRFPDGSEDVHIEVSEHGGPNSGSRLVALSTAVHALLNLGPDEIHAVENRTPVSELDGLEGEPIGTPCDCTGTPRTHEAGDACIANESRHEHSSLKQCDPSCPGWPSQQMERHHEPTTAEAFATVRAELPVGSLGWNALSMLERRMGEQAVAMREALGACEAGELRKMRETLRSALTDAPEVYTREDVERVLTPITVPSHSAVCNDVKAAVLEGLVALRSRP